MTWHLHAACIGHDPGLWFPAVTFGGAQDGRSGGCTPADYRAAKVICDGCPVRARCLEEALDTEASGSACRAGMFGGLTPDERSALGRRPLTSNRVTRYAGASPSRLLGRSATEALTPLNSTKPRSQADA